MGATFGGAGESALSPLIDLAFALTSDGTLPGQAGNDQPTIETLLKGKMQESEGWGGATKDALFSGLPEGVPFVLGLIAKLAEQITGIDISGWIDDWNSLPLVGELPDIIGDALGTIFTQSVNLLSIFGDLNFLDPDFDPIEALTSFIELMLSIPDLLVGLVGGLIPDDLFGGFDASKIISGEFPMEMISGLLDFLADVPGLSQLLDWFGLDPDGSELDLQNLLGGFLSGDSPLDAFNLFNLIPSNLLSIVPFSIIGDTSHENLLTAGGFLNSIAIQGSGIWTFDAVNGRTEPGCVSVNASGTERRLLSNAIPVAVGDKINTGVYSKWAGLTYTGVPIRLRMTRFLNYVAVGTDNLGAPTTPVANQTSWLLIDGGTYTVPSGCDKVCLELTITATATAGTVKFDDAEAFKDNLLQIPWTEDLPDSLQDLLDGVQSAFDTIFEGITGVSQIGTLIADVIAALQSIPFFNVLGVGGPTDIGSTMQALWDQYVGGMVGTVGTGAGLADVFNISQLISSWASLGRDAFDITGIRSNKSLFSGFAPTAVSSMRMDGLAFAKNTSGVATTPTVPTTQAAALTGWHRVEEAIDVGAFGYTGGGVAGITAFYMNLWRMDDSGNISCTHHSADKIGLLSGTTADVDYDMPSSVHYEAGDLIGIELHPIGAGTHNVVGDVTWRNFNANTVPRRWSSKRNAGTGTGTPSSILAASVDYATTNVPFTWYGVSSGAVPLPRTPTVSTFNTAGTTTMPVPDWVNTIQPVAVGGGGAGRQGGTYGISGEGGENGDWNYGTEWKRGVHYSGNPIISVAIAAKAQGGGDSGTSGGVGNNGGNVVITLPATPGFSATSITATGGEGGDALNAGGSDKQGQSPGNITFDTQPYVGAPQQNTFGADGGSPGAGGAGGNYVSFQLGGKGGLGGGWLRMKQ